MNIPYPDITFPLTDYDRLCFLINITNHHNITVEEYTYYDDFEDVDNFNQYRRDSRC
jgi:virginiamycin A acetyltransferase